MQICITDMAKNLKFFVDVILKIKTVQNIYIP